MRIMDKEKIIKLLFVLMLIVVPTNIIVSKFIFELLLSEIFIGIFILSIFVFYYKDTYTILKKYKYFLILSSLFVFSLFLSSVLSIVPRFSIIKWFEFYFTGLLFAVSFLLLLENGFTKEYFLKTIIRVGLFYAVMGIIEAIFHNKILRFLEAVRIPSSINDYPKIAGIFEWHTVFGSVMAFNMIISFILYFRKRISKIEFVISEILFLIGVILSTSRNALFTIFVGFILIILFYKKSIFKMNRRRLLLYVLIFMILIYFLYQLYPPATQSVNRFLGLFSGNKDIAERLDGVGSGRITIIKIALNTFSKFPIFGVGIRVFPYYSKIFLHTHNIFLQFLTEGGVIGLILFLILLYYIFKKAIKYKLKFEIVLLFIFVFNQSFGYFVGHIYYFTLYMWFIFALNSYGE